MKKRHGLQWKKFHGKERNSDSLTEVLVAAGAAVLFDLLCALIFLHSTANMVKMVYVAAEYSAAFFARAIYLILIVSVLMEAAEHVKKWQAVLIRLGVISIGSFAVTRWAVKETILEQLTSGLWDVVSIYLGEWNRYFSSNLQCPKGNEEYAEFFLEFVLLTVTVLLLWLAKLVRRNSVMAVFPSLVFAAGLMVGMNPSDNGVLLLFLGILLACNQRYSVPDFKPSEEKKGKYTGKWRQFGWIFSVAVITLICVSVLIVGRKSAERVVTEYAGEAEDRILDTANQVANWEIWRMIDDPGGVEKLVESVLGTTDYNYETLNNRTPVYEDVPYLKITMEQKPLERVYLKGFYADTYENGIWERKEGVFTAKSQEAGIQTEFVTEELAVLGVEKLKKRYNVKDLSVHNSGVEVTVFYYDPSTAKAYIPYFSEISCEGVSVEGEGNFKKRLSEEELVFTMWKYAGNFDTRLRNFAQGIQKEWEGWYEDYVLEQYLEVPDNMPNVKKIAAELAMKDLTRTELGSISSENEERLAKGYLVADWMGRNTTYSLTLPKLPWTEDPIEYFLGTSRMGYCMHYASAAVMILREMGVPARYASGYVVGKSSFKEEANGYVAEVLDNQAHAWAEIYLDGIGWVPVEVTAGYSTLIPTPTPTPTSTNTPTPTPTNTPTPVPTKATATPSVGPTVTQIPSATGTPMTPVPTIDLEQTVPPYVVTLTPTPTPTQGSSELGNEVNDIGIEGVEGDSETRDGEVNQTPLSPLGEKKSWGKTLGKSLLLVGVVIIIALILLSPATVVDRFFRLEKLFHRRILKEMRRKGNARAIKMVNRSIYRKLCFSGMIKKGCTDLEYEAALKANFSVLWPKDWERYMTIVKAAEFSLREFSDEEVEFCYKIYRDIIY